MDSKPNILYIMTDQQSADAMSEAGNPHLNTPALDRLAARGVRFDCAYTAFPLCVPARTALFTSRMPHETGVFDNHPQRHAGLPFPMLGRLMTDAGYQSHYIGKWHIPSVAESDTASHGFDEVVFGGGYGDLDRNKTAKAVEFLQQSHDRPFFLTVSYNNPHDCCELSRGDELKMENISSPPGELSELPPLPDNHNIPENEPEALREFQQAMKKYLLAYQWDEKQTRQYLWGYYRLTEIVDREIGRLLETLDQTGLADNTVIIFTSDHGDGHGCHQWNQKWSLYDESARVPFLVSDPHAVNSGSINSAPTNPILDLMPTVLDYAGLPIPEQCRGKSVRPMVEKDTPPTREFVVTETDLCETEVLPDTPRLRGRMVRTQRFKYIVFENGKNPEQFFDMQNDPGEMHNLVTNPEYQSQLKQHRHLLQNWCKETNDDFE